MSHALRQEAIPIKQLWDILLGRDLDMVIYEDNEGSILFVENGYSPALRQNFKGVYRSVASNRARR